MAVTADQLEQIIANICIIVCRTHYVEYLCGLVIKEKLEVVSLMELGEVKAVFTRAGKFIPRQRPGEYEFKYLKRLAQVANRHLLKTVLSH